MRNANDNRTYMHVNLIVFRSTTTRISRTISTKCCSTTATTELPTAKCYTNSGTTETYAAKCFCASTTTEPYAAAKYFSTSATTEPYTINRRDQNDVIKVFNDKCQQVFKHTMVLYSLY